MPHRLQHNSRERRRQYLQYCHSYWRESCRDYSRGFGCQGGPPNVTAESCMYGGFGAHGILKLILRVLQDIQVRIRFRQSDYTCESTPRFD